MTGDEAPWSCDSVVSHTPACPKGETITVSIPLGSFNLSGGVKVLVALANGMAARGWGVTFLSPDFAAVLPFPLAPGVKVMNVRTGPAWLPLTVRQVYHYVKLALLAARRVDLCLANYFPTAFCAVLSKTFVNRKAAVVYYVQGYEAVSHGLVAEANAASRVIRYLLARLSYRLPGLVICVSRWVQEQVGRADSLVAHAPALDLSVFRPQRRTKADLSVVIGTIGRRGKNKGYNYFLRAMHLLPSLEHVKVLVASPNANEVSLPHEVPAELIQARCEQAMVDFYNHCDIFVLSSLMEGFPLPPLEAMACGCAVVVTACGGVSDYAQDGVNCLMVPPADPHALARAVWTLCRDARLRAHLIDGGMTTAGRFQRDWMVEGFLDFLVPLVPIGLRENPSGRDPSRRARRSAPRGN